MATRVATLGETPGLGRMPKPLRRLGGLGLFCLALLLATALVSYNPADPSFSHATGAAASNLLGPKGAIVADAAFQFFGLGAWLVVLVGLSWGVRLVLQRPFAWPWLTVLALPLALLALAGLLGSLPHPGPGAWPIRVGLGGLVGFLLRDWFEPTIGATAFFLAALAATLTLGLVALGIRLSESLWAGRWVRRASLWTAGGLGRAGLYSGRLVQSGLDRRRGAGLLARALAALQPLRELLRMPGREEPEPVPHDAAPYRAVRPARRPAELVPEPPPDPVRPTQPRPVPGLKAEPGLRAEPVRLVPASPAPIRHEPDAAGVYELPPVDLLAPVKTTGQAGFSKEALALTSRELETVLDDFGVRGQITDAKPGPVVTLYELEPAPGTRAARVISLADDIARSLCALSVRVAVVPGRNVIGIELPNDKRETVYLRDLIQSEGYETSNARLPLALGKDISGRQITVDLARMPHLLIAGTTGAGKSVAINAMILSLLYRLTPEQCRLIMIDPKVIELSVYEDIPHLLAPVVTEPHKAVVALKWVVRQMDERYRLMSHLNVRDIFSFNKRILQAQARGEALNRRVRTGFEPGTGAPIYEEQPIESKPLPLIVVIVDEVADLMLTAGKEIENAIQRLSQKARAAGVHLIVATQRPSVDVLTGVIKANLPSRISFRVSSKIDSRTILGEPGAEQLLGQGDMLYLMPGDRISRIHGPLVTDGEVEAVVRHWKAQGEPDYVEDVTREGGEEGGAEPGSGGPLFDGVPAGSGDSVYQQAVQIVLSDGKASTSYLQRKLQIGYNSAAKLIERMENEGVISTADHVGRRQVLMGRGGVDGNEPTQI